jgi:glutamate racemase
MDKTNPIGIFDSGVGGLTVLKEVKRILPCEDIIYFGDTARVPYGNKSKSTIIKFSTENILFLLKKKVKIVIIACNTSSALALDYLKKAFNVPIVGVIEAGVKKALEVSDNKRIAVIGTRSTISSKAYEKEIKKQNRNAKVYSQSCPLFVPLVEEGLLEGKIVKQIIKMYLEKIKIKKVDSLILGCTHYPLLKKAIAEYFKGIKIIDSAQEVASYTRELLGDKDLLNPQINKGRREFYVSDEPVAFGKLAKLFLNKNISTPNLANV